MWPVWVSRDRRQNRPGKASYGLLKRQGPHLARLRHSLLRGGMDCSKIRVGWRESEPTVPDFCDLLMNERVRDQKQVPSRTPVRWMAGLGIDPGAPLLPSFASSRVCRFRSCCTPACSSCSTSQPGRRVCPSETMGFPASPVGPHRRPEGTWSGPATHWRPLPHPAHSPSQCPPLGRHLLQKMRRVSARDCVTP